MDRNLFRSMVTFVAMFILVLGVGTASAQHASKNKPDNPNQKDTFRSMSPDELKQLEAAIAPALSQSAEGLVVKDGPAGSKYVDLQGRFQSVAIANVGSDGQVQTQCVINMNEAKQFLESDKPATEAKASARPANAKAAEKAPASKPESANWEVQ